jgi:hypothetical protein
LKRLPAGSNPRQDPKARDDTLDTDDWDRQDCLSSGGAGGNGHPAPSSSNKDPILEIIPSDRALRHLFIHRIHPSHPLISAPAGGSDVVLVNGKPEVKCLGSDRAEGCVERAADVVVSEN